MNLKMAVQRFTIGSRTAGRNKSRRMDSHPNCHSVLPTESTDGITEGTAGAGPAGAEGRVNIDGIEQALATAQLASAAQ